MNIARVPQMTTVPTAAATSWESASTMGCAAAAALRPQIPLPVAISVARASLSPSSRPPAKAERERRRDGVQVGQHPGGPNRGSQPKVTLAP